MKKRSKTSAPKTTRPSLSRRRRLWLIGLGTLALLSLTFASYCFSYQGQLLPRLYVGGVSVGGLTPAAAQTKLTNAVANLQNWSVSVDGAEPTSVDLTSIADFDIEGMVIAAQRYTAGDTVWQWFVRRAKSLVMRQHAPVIVSFNAANLRAGLDAALYSHYDNDAQEVSLSIKSGKVSVKDGQPGMIVERAPVESAAITHIYDLTVAPLSVNRVQFNPQFTVADAEFAKRQAERIIASPLVVTWDGGEIGADLATVTSWITSSAATAGDDRYAPAVSAGAPANESILLVDIDQTKLADWLKLISAQIERDPTNATVTFTDGSVRLATMGRNGLRLLSDESVSAIRDALLRRGLGTTVSSVAAVTESIAPVVSDQSINQLGIKELIGRASTDYSGSAENRRKNIALGAQKMNGYILLPGEEYSALDVIGPVTAAAGFLPEKVIVNNKIELEYGGGLCQLATTLFRAVLDAGLPVTSRQNHSRRVSYYEKGSSVKGVRINWDSSYANIGSGLVGYDATVYEPAPDLKFKNDTGAAILIEVTITNDRQVTYDLYGTNDGRQVSVSKAQVLYTKAPTDAVYEDDPTLPAGTEQLVEKAVPGAKTSFNYTVTYADGRKESRDFISIYKAIAPRYLRGTGPVADPAAAPAT